VGPPGIFFRFETGKDKQPSSTCTVVLRLGLLTDRIALGSDQDPRIVGSIWGYPYLKLTIRRMTDDPRMAVT
jgi:hypothetical protein